MANPFEEPFAKPKQRKSGVAPLVGDMFGPGAQRAMEKVTGKEKKKPTVPALREDWEGADITMSAAEKAGMQIEKEHIRLQNVPTFTELPDEDTLKKDFNFDWIWKQQFREDRPVTDFALTDVDLRRIGVDEQTHVRIMEAMSKAKETLLLAKIFDIGDIIRQKLQADPNHPAHLSTKEVFEAIDAAGYRPATLQELLAYGRDHWKPDIDLDGLTEEGEKQRQLANAPYIYALGSPFSRSGGSRGVPYLRLDKSGRFLSMDDFGKDWGSNLRFLVFRKGSS